MTDVLVKTRFTPALLRTPAKDDVQVGPSRYDAPVAKGNGKSGAAKPAPKPRGAHLRACPFCRELFVDDETDTCPECGIVVRDLADLPPSPDAEALEAEEGKKGVAPTVPQAEPLPWTHMGRGRALLLACAALGLVAFYLPWAIQTLPHAVTYNGSDMAKVKSFYWSAFTAWFILIPAVLTRRTILKMIGARVALVCLSAIPGMTAAMMLMNVATKRTVNFVPFEFHWGPGVYLTLVLSVIATLVSLRFGGRLDDIKVRKESSAGNVLH